MKKHRETITSLFFSLLLLSIAVACNMGTNEKKHERSKNKSGTVVSTSEYSDVYLEADSWRNWSPPKALLGYKLQRFVTDPFKLTGLYSANARYEKGEKWMDVQLIDGSTEKGTAEIRDHLEIAGLQRDHSSEYGYEKTLERKGIKAKEEYLSPPAGQYMIKFMLREYYGVSVKSNAETAAEIWHFIDQLKMEELGE
ncbi:hypothetical protein [Eudoraea sp.]|uniref:hypothetical protein n=3 Tax=Eudoraea sp. TaxID=1979955 RepID=UPI003C78F9F0